MLQEQHPPRVYSVANEAAGEWPVLLGTLGDDDRLVPYKAPENSMFALNRYLNERAHVMKEFFAECDERKQGVIDGSKLKRLIRMMLPSTAASSAELQFVEACLDPDHTGRITFKGVAIAATDCAAFDEVRAAAAAKRVVPEELKRLQQAIREAPGALSALGRGFQVKAPGSYLVME